MDENIFKRNCVEPPSNSSAMMGKRNASWLAGWNARQVEVDALKERIRNLESQVTAEGHNKPCYYCSKPCNALAGNPSQWPIPMCHADDPGKVKWHHIGCVSERLRK